MQASISCTYQGVDLFSLDTGDWKDRIKPSNVYVQQKGILKTNTEQFLGIFNHVGLASWQSSWAFCGEWLRGKATLWLCCLSSRVAILKIQTGNLGVAPDLLLEVTPWKQLSDVSSSFSPSVTWSGSRKLQLNVGKGSRTIIFFLGSILKWYLSLLGNTRALHVFLRISFLPGLNLVLRKMLRPENSQNHSTL